MDDTITNYIVRSVLQISDDEDDVHPNIDTPSLFRWRHQARVERMDDLDREKQQLEEQKAEHKRAVQLAEAKLAKGGVDATEVKKQLTELEKKSKDLTLHEQSIESKERKAPWNVDTISKPAFSKTIINTQAIRATSDAHLSEEEREQRMKQFVKEQEPLLKQYGMLKRFDDSKRFLMEHTQLTCENTANYLVIWCINLEMENKTELMGHVAHQFICMQFILELSKQLDIDPRGCVSSFFSRIQVAEPEYKRQFESEIAAFKTRIQLRAKEKVAEALAEQEEEERQQRLGPGGLDPMEVFESLPEELQKCFEARDIPMLQAAIGRLPPDEAKLHLKRCVDSGLWVPEGGLAAEAGEGGDDQDAEEDDEEDNDVLEAGAAAVVAAAASDRDAEPIYSEAKPSATTSIEEVD